MQIQGQIRYKFFSKHSNSPLWSGSGFTGSGSSSVSISPDGLHIAFGFDDGIYYFKNHIPIATINNVSSGVVVYGDTITFNGSATDSDGSISIYEWTSSIDGIISNESSFSLSNLSVGTHLIKFRAQDNHTFWSEFDTYQIIVTPNSSPTITLVSPGNNSQTYPNPMLKWNASDNNSHQDLTFKVYLGETEDSMSVIASGITAQQYRIRASLDSTYYWKVIVSDGYTNVSSSVFNFTTPNQLGPVWSDQPSSSQNPTSVAMSDDGSVIAMTSGNEKLYVYSRNSSTPEWYYDANKEILSSVVSGDGKYVAIGLGWVDDSNWGRVILFQTNSSTPLWSYTTSGQIYKIDISYNGSYIVSGGKEGKLRLHYKDSSTPLATKNVADVNDVAISNDGKYYSTACDDDKVYVFVRGSTSSWSHALGDDATRISMTPDGEYLAVASRDGKVYYFETESLSEKWSFDTGEEVWGVGISDDGLKVTAGNRDSEIYLLNSTGSQMIWKYTGSDNFDQISLSGDGNYILAGQADGMILLFDTSNSTPYGEYEIGVFRTQSEYVPTQVETSFLGDWFAGISTDKYLRFFRNPDNFAPYIFDLSPAKDARIITDTVTLSWNSSDYETPNATIYYNVYFGTDKTNLSTVSTNQTTKNWVSGPLNDGLTYWWRVQSSDGMDTRFVERSFLVNTIPVVNLTSPMNWSYIPNTDGQVRLQWEAFDGDGDDLEFSIYIGDSQNNLSFLASTTNNSYICDGLGTNITYIWKIKVSDFYEEGYNISSFNLFDRLLPTVKYLDSLDENPTYIDITDDGSLNLIVGSSGLLSINNYSDEIWSDSNFEGTVDFPAISGNGKYFAVAGNRGNDGDEKLHFFEQDGENTQHTWSYNPSNNYQVTAVDISGDGEYVVVCSSDGYAYYGYIHLLHRNSSTPVWSYGSGSDEKAFQYCKISYDGKYIIAGNYNQQSNSRKVIYFKTSSSTPLWQHDLGAYNVYSVTISDNGDYAAVATALSGNSKLLFFGKNSSSPIWTFSEEDMTVSSYDGIDISGDGNYVGYFGRVENENDGIVRLFSKIAQRHYGVTILLVKCMLVSYLEMERCSWLVQIMAQSIFSEPRIRPLFGLVMTVMRMRYIILQFQGEESISQPKEMMMLIFLQIFQLLIKLLIQ